MDRAKGLKTGPQRKFPARFEPVCAVSGEDSDQVAGIRMILARVDFASGFAGDPGLEACQLPVEAGGCQAASANTNGAGSSSAAIYQTGMAGKEPFR